MNLPAYQSISTHQIRSSTHQARKTFDEENLKALAESMKAEGLIQPITVRRILDFGSEIVDFKEPPFELVSGERRLRAAKLLGWETIEAKVIQTVSEAEAAAKGLVENLQRQDLNPIEKGEGFKELNQLDAKYWTQDRMAQVFGKSQSEISKSLRFLNLPEQVKENIRHRIISEDQAAELVRLPSADLQSKVADMIVKKGLNSKATRRVVDSLIKPAKGPKRKPIQSAGVGFMAPLWPPLMTNTRIAACGYWKVEFKKDGWHFIASDEKFGDPRDFAEWFHQMGDVLSAIANSAVAPATPSVVAPADSKPGPVTPPRPLTDEEEQIQAALEDGKKIGSVNEKSTP